GRFNIATDPTQVITPVGATTNSYNYDPNSDRGVAKGAPWVKSSTGNAGLLMFYHSKMASDLNQGSANQLGEFTIRDPYLKNFNIPDSSNQNITLINYDVSYVDSLLLPVAMEADAVPIPSSQSDHPGNYGTEPFGWVGADKTTKQINDAVV